MEILKSELLLQTYSLAAKLDYNSTQFVRNGIKKYFSFNNDVGLECCKELQGSPKDFCDDYLKQSVGSLSLFDFIES